MFKLCRNHKTLCFILICILLYVFISPLQGMQENLYFPSCSVAKLVAKAREIWNDILLCWLKNMSKTLWTLVMSYVLNNPATIIVTNGVGLSDGQLQMPFSVWGWEGGRKKGSKGKKEDGKGREDVGGWSFGTISWTLPEVLENHHIAWGMHFRQSSAVLVSLCPRERTLHIHHNQHGWLAIEMCRVVVEGAGLGGAGAEGVWVSRWVRPGGGRSGTAGVSCELWRRA